MKKALAFILCMVLALTAFVACGDEEKADSKASDSSAEASVDTSKEESKEESAESSEVSTEDSSAEESSAEDSSVEDSSAEESSADDSSDESAETTEEYTTYANDYISFAYPESWTASEEGGIVTIVSEDSVFNIALTSEAASDVYASMDTDGFVATFQPMLEAMGLTVSDPMVDQMVNANDEDVTVIGYVAEYAGVQMYQTLMVVTSGDTCQVITLTEVYDGGDLAQNIFDSIEVLK